MVKFGSGGGRGGGKGGGRGRGAKPAGVEKSGPVKKRLRSIERLLSKSNGSLPDDVRKAKEAELAELHGDASRQARKSRERHFSKKYHGVKFIERRKVERRIGQLKRQIEDGGDVAALEAELQEAEHDLLYIRHFPPSKKYLALFAADAADPYVVKRRRRIRALIVRRVEAGLPVHGLGDDGDEDEADLAAPAADAGALEADDFFPAPEGDGGAAADGLEQAVGKASRKKGKGKDRARS